MEMMMTKTKETAQQGIAERSVVTPKCDENQHDDYITGDRDPQDIPKCQKCGFVHDDRCMMDGYYVHDMKKPCRRYWDPEAKHTWMTSEANRKRVYISTIATAITIVDRKWSAVEKIQYHFLAALGDEYVEIRFATCDRSVWINVTGTSCGWILRDILDAIYGDGARSETPEWKVKELMEKDKKMRKETQHG